MNNISRVSSPHFSLVFTTATLTLILALFLAPGIALAAEKEKGEQIPPPPDVAEIPEDAELTATGLAFKILQEGTGEERPTAQAKVTVNYTGWTTDGKTFDSTEWRGKPSSFPVNRVIRGWTEGLQLMVVGEKRRFWIKPTLAYGLNVGRGLPKGMLVFDVELLDIVGPPPVPEDVAGPPEGAGSSKSGLAWRVLQEGTGTEHPKARSKVTVHYTGWTTDGAMFDSSVIRGEPATFGLTQVIKGWTEGLQLMVVGEKRRFWIPGKLGYGNKPRPGRPHGMLVFDVELIEIE